MHNDDLVQEFSLPQYSARHICQSALTWLQPAHDLVITGWAAHYFLASYINHSYHHKHFCQKEAFPSFLEPKVNIFKWLRSFN